MLLESSLTPNATSPGPGEGRRFNWCDAQLAFLLGAFKERGCIGDNTLSVNFTRGYAGDHAPVSNISVTINLENGRPLASYHLIGEISPELMKEILSLLIHGKVIPGKGVTFTPLEIARELYEKTKPASDLRTSALPEFPWVSKRLLECVNDERHVAPMIHVIPTLKDFLDSPNASRSRFFCAKEVDGLQWKLEAEIVEAERRAKFGVFVTDAQEIMHHQRFFELVGTNLGAELPLAECKKELILQTYRAMEVFWNSGPEAFWQHVESENSTTAEEMDNASEPPAGDGALADFMVHHFEPECTVRDRRSQAEALFFPGGHQGGVLLLRNSPSEEDARVWWSFQDVGNLSDPTNPIRQDILACMKMLTAIDSDEVRLSAIDRLDTLKSQRDSRAAFLDSLVGEACVERLSTIPGIVVEPIPPRDPQEILLVSRGTRLMRVSLLDRSITRKHPEFFDRVYIGLEKDGSMRFWARNQLNGLCRCDASAAAVQAAGGIDSTLEKVSSRIAAQWQRGYIPVQKAFLDLARRDDDRSWYSHYGDPVHGSLPATDDLQGQFMYDTCAKIACKYASISGGEPSHSTVNWLGRGAVSIELGMSNEPFSMTLVLQDGCVTSIKLAPREQVGEKGAATADGIAFACQLPIHTGDGPSCAKGREKLVSIMMMFDDLITRADHARRTGIDINLADSPLHNYLGQNFRAISSSD